LYIFYRKNRNEISKSIIDLIFCTPAIQEKGITWNILEEEKLGSDYETIYFSIELDFSKLVENMLYANQYNFTKVDWEEVLKVAEKTAQEYKFQWSATEINEHSLELEAEKLENLVLKIID
jgi:hypothetical protein